MIQPNNNIKPLVSVCINTYNQVKYIKDAIDGALMQKTNFKYEILVGENSSIDGTKEICIEYERKHPENIRLFHNSRKDVIYINGRPTGRANMMSLWHNSKGKYIALCNGDDYWTDPYKLQKQVEVLEQNSKFAGCFHETQQIYADGKIGNIYGKEASLVLHAEETFATLSPFHTSSFMFKNLIRKLPGWFSEIVSGDMALFSMVAAHGPLMKIAEIMSVYRKLESGMTSDEKIVGSYHSDRIKLIQHLNSYHKYKYNKKANQVIAFHETNLAKQKESENGRARQEMRNPNPPAANQYHRVNDKYLNISLTPDNMDLYYVRSSIKRAIDRNLHNFRGTLLDVGCGEMPYREYLIANSGITKYIGLDIENQVYQQNVKPDIYWNGKHIDLPDDYVDCAIAAEVFEHLSNFKTVLKEINRVLKPGGKIFFTLPFIWPLHDMPHDEYRYTPFSLRRLLRKSGFDNINIEALGGWNASLAQMIGLWIRRSPMTAKERDFFAENLFPFYKMLIEKESNKKSFSYDHMLNNSIMVTGLYGTATSPYQIEKKETNGAENIINIEVNKVNSLPSIKKDSILAIVCPYVGAVSETFIRNHIEHIAPGKTVVLTGNVLDDTWLKSPVRCIPLTSTPSTFDPDVEREVLGFLARHRVTHLLCEYGSIGTEIVILNQRSLHLPIFVHFHGFDAAEELRKPKIIKYYQWMGENVTGVIVDTQIQKSRLAEIGVPDQKIQIIPYGVEIPDILATPDTTPCRFICVGRLYPKKGMIYMLKAFHKARGIVPNITLDLIGDGPLMEEVQTFVTAHNMQSAVAIHGARPNDFVKKLMRESCVYLQHSVTDPVSGDAEGLPVAILEAAAFGLPTVSTFHEGIPDEVEQGITGFLVNEFDVDAMSMYMVHLAGDSELRKTMGMAARKKIEREFTLDQEISSLRTFMSLSEHSLGMINNKQCKYQDILASP